VWSPSASDVALVPKWYGVSEYQMDAETNPLPGGMGGGGLGGSSAISSLRRRFDVDWSLYRDSHVLVLQLSPVELYDASGPSRLQRIGQSPVSNPNLQRLVVEPLPPSSQTPLLVIRTRLW